MPGDLEHSLNVILGPVPGRACPADADNPPTVVAGNPGAVPIIMDRVTALMAEYPLTDISPRPRHQPEQESPPARSCPSGPSSSPLRTAQTTISWFEPEPVLSWIR